MQATNVIFIKKTLRTEKIQDYIFRHGAKVNRY